VDLVRVPALFNATARLHAQAFYTAVALDRLDELRAPFFEEIHVRGNPLDTAASIEAFFGRFGVESRAFRDAFNSVGVYRALERAEALNRAYGVDATPSLGINGRYLTDPSMAGSADAVFEIVDELVETEAHESCRDRRSPSCPLGNRLATDAGRSDAPRSP
jgi:protein dithiol oxidoreductase (disulfide-forming)